MAPAERGTRPRRWLRWTLVAVAIVLGPGVLARSVAAPRLARTFGVPVRIGWVWWDPFTGRWIVTGVRVGAEHAEPAFSARQLVAAVYLWDIARGYHRIRELHVARARARLTETPAGWTLPVHVHTAGGAGGGLFFTLEDGELRHGRLSLEPAAGAPSRLDVGHLRLATAGVQPEATWASGRLRGGIAGRALRAALSYRAAAARSRTRARLVAHRLDLERLTPLPPASNRRLAGFLSLRGAYEATTRDGRARRVGAGDVRLRRAAIRAGDQPGITVRALTLARSRVGLVARKATLGTLRIHQPEAWIERAVAGLGILGLWEPGPAAAGRPWRITARGATLDARRLHYQAADRPPLGVAVPHATVGRVSPGGAPVPVGLVDELAPAKITGTIGETTRLTLDVKQFAMPPLNPYVEPVSAYEVSSGELTLHSEIVLRRSQLEATNRPVLTRLGVTGGGARDFLTEQLGIPLTLALAMMKDYRGNIELSIPVRGDPSVPSFSIASLVLQAVVQAIKGAMLSPLNLLGRLVLGEGGRIERIEIQPIRFPAGSATPDAATRRRMSRSAGSSVSTRSSPSRCRAESRTRTYASSAPARRSTTST